MRRLTILISLLALFVCQANETLHEHSLGHVDQDCVACHSNSNPAHECLATITLEAPTYTVDAPLPLLARPLLRAVSLLTAPKTSPPIS
ncbi:MAG: hypothetical protein ABI333_09000 [bacterium]